MAKSGRDADNGGLTKTAMLGLRGVAIFLVCIGVMIIADGRLGAALGRQEKAGIPKPPSSLRFHQSATDGAYNLAYQESGGFFDDIREQDWNMLKERMRTTPRCSRNCEAELSAHWYQNNWEPNFTCLHERRVGRWGDGGKWVCDPHRIAEAAKRSQRPCLVYSIGSANDFSFEEAVLAQVSEKCEIHTFDPTVGEHPSNLPSNGKVQFHPWGLANAESGAYKTLETIQRKLGHKDREVDIFKIDCEGCEWETFKGWFDGVPVPPRQILIELHDGTEGASPVQAMQFMSFLEDRGYVIFHKEPNTLGCGGNCIEYAFLWLGGITANRTQAA